MRLRVQPGTTGIGVGGGDLDTTTEASIRHPGGGGALPRALRSQMEQAMGADFSAVRVHTDRAAGGLARSLSARAFTSGRDLFFAPGAYDPASTHGQETIAHELAHVVQQGSAASRVQRYIGPTMIGEVREGDGVVGKLTTTTDIDSVPDEFIWLADSIQQSILTEESGTEYGDSDTFTAPEGASGFLNSAAILGGTRTMLSGASDTFSGAMNLGKGFAEDDSLKRNLGAQQLESGLTGFTGGYLDTAYGVSGLLDTFGPGEIPFVGDVANLYQAGVKSKKAVEDTVAAEKLRSQGRKAKHETDHHLPDDVRKARFQEFLTAYNRYDDARSERKAAKGAKATLSAKGTELMERAGFKSGDVSRFEKARAKWGGDVNADPLGFLNFCRDNGIKEFGKGTDARKEYQQEVKAGTKTASTDYKESRSLEKVTAFGHRRKAESATLNAVEATGHTLDAVGTFTAGGDYGATKATGKAIKAGAASYKGIKSLVKRGRRVHKLRQAKNEAKYGDKSDRGVLWGTKQFFVGNVSGSQDKVRSAIQEGRDTSYSYKYKDPTEKQPAGKWTKKVHKKGIDLKGKTDADKARLIKLVTIQAMRRVGDLVNCLGSDNDQTFHRACQILKVIAQTNLAGALARISQGDLDKFRVLARAVKAGTATEAQKKTYKERRGTIEEIFKKQLSGVGG